MSDNSMTTLSPIPQHSWEEDIGRVERYEEQQLFRQEVEEVLAEHNSLPEVSGSLYGEPTVRVISDRWFKARD